MKELLEFLISLDAFTLHYLRLEKNLQSLLPLAFCPPPLKGGIQGGLPLPHQKVN